ncbi:DNA-directed RNA polymerase II core subunit rpb9 [Lithohypha guttulata]|uniref:DNA-directed RNA polymerase II core subunit rpb9 n=1 Tax=Lithohypha guttulata TaxID=1690604 RepID=A0AAN7Y511_9EURO|nr:DNA-directed RNA polymerase II core subunit rpb9 [Lithohypha guttulata]
MSMASPTASEEGAGSGEIAYRFCQECSNLLYPREDRAMNKLLYICKSCHSVQEHESACTYRQNLSEAAQESMGEKAYVANDPTVGNPSPIDDEDDMVMCTMCGQCLRCSKCGLPNNNESEEDQTQSSQSEQRGY